MSAGQRPVKQIQIARDLQLSPATVSRIVRALADEGYLLITPERYCVRNFRLSRNVPMSESYQSLLNRLMQDISTHLAASVETVVVTGFELFWHNCTEFPDASIAIKAKPGFRRTLAELDPLARLYLSRTPWESINEALRPSGFFRNDLNRNPIDATDARELIEGASSKIVDFDFEGNHLGVRRFATLVDDEEGRFMHLLSIAEPATPVIDHKAHVDIRSKLLIDARETLKGHIKLESEKAKTIHEHKQPVTVSVA